MASPEKEAEKEQEGAKKEEEIQDENKVKKERLEEVKEERQENEEEVQDQLENMLRYESIDEKEFDDSEDSSSSYTSEIVSEVRA